MIMFCESLKNSEKKVDIDNYNASAYYEPSYVITRAYNNGEF